MKYTGLCHEARADRVFEMYVEKSPNFWMGRPLSFCIIPGTSGFSQLELILQIKKKYLSQTEKIWFLILTIIVRKNSRAVTVICIQIKLIYILFAVVKSIVSPIPHIYF